MLLLSIKTYPPKTPIPHMHSLTPQKNLTKIIFHTTLQIINNTQSIYLLPRHNMHLPLRTMLALDHPPLTLLPKRALSTRNFAFQHASFFSAAQVFEEMHRRGDVFAKSDGAVERGASCEAHDPGDYEGGVGAGRVCSSVFVSLVCLLFF